MMLFARLLKAFDDIQFIQEFLRGYGCAAHIQSPFEIAKGLFNLIFASINLQSGYWILDAI